MNRDRLNVAYLILGVASLIVIGFGVFSLMEIEHQQSREVQEEIAGNLSRPVWNYNIPTINSILNQTMLFNPFQEIAVYDLDGTALYENRNTQLNQEEGLKLFFFPRTSSSMRILYQSEVIGTLKIIAVNRSIYSIAVFVLLCLLAVGLLANLFHSRRQNRLLKDSLSEVIHLQEQLIETRHHAALGALLRGLAHEINTPLGNAILLVNNIDPNHQIENRMDPAKAQKTALENINTAIPLLNTALRRIVNIIQRFKTVGGFHRCGGKLRLFSRGHL
jgi:signal transduction histidine kinase